MCLPGNTLVLTPSSEKKIASLTKGDLVLGFSLEGKLIQDKVVKVYERTTNDLFIIKTSLGIDFIGTAEHPVWTSVGWKTIDKLDYSDRIAYINKIQWNPISIHMLDLLPVEDVYIPNSKWIFNEVKKKKGLGKHRLAKILGVKHPGNIYHYKKGLKSIKISWLFKLQALLDMEKEDLYSRIDVVKSKYGNPFKVSWLTPEFMWIVGLIASDGNINSCKDARSGSLTASIRIFNTDLRILEKAKEILESMYINVKINERNNSNIYIIEFGNTLLAKLLLKCGIAWKKKTFKVFVPDFFYTLDEKLLWAYFSGIFDGDGNLTYLEDKYISSIRISTACKDFAFGLHKLLLHLGILSTITTRSIDKKVVLHGKNAHFKAKKYIVAFRKKRDLIKFRENGYITKCEIPNIKYSTYHNVNKRGNTSLPMDYVKIKEKKRVTDSIKVYNIQTKKTNTFFANNFLVHNCGRAGRPQFDNEGESLLLAKQERALSWLMERYVLRDPEAIYSKLAAKPALRRNILGLIASRVVNTVPELLSFFEKTFYGFQFEAVLLENKIREIIDLFIVWEMINPLDANETLKATSYGHRVSQLYLDPETAAALAEGLANSMSQASKKVHSIAFLDLIVGTPDMIELSFHKRDFKQTEERFKHFTPKLIKPIPDLLDIEYEFRLRDFKTVLFLYDWIREIPVEKIIVRYNIGSGDIKRIVDTATWLISATTEIAELKVREDKRYERYARKARALSERVTYGIKSDAVSLTRVRGIGRKRARVLLDHGIRDITQLTAITVPQLCKIPGFGTELATSILDAATQLIKSDSPTAVNDYTNGDIQDYIF